MAEKFDWTDVEIIRSQAKTKMKRAKDKKERAKTAPEAKQHKRLTSKSKIVLRADPNSKGWLLKSAKRGETEAAALMRKAEKMASILTAAAQGPEGK